MYKLLRKLLFLLPAEQAHYVSMNGLRIICSVPLIRRALSRVFAPGNESAVTVFGLSFKNSVGLGAGFDKNARYLRELECMGFGFVEIGTVTPKPQAGNEKPRLFRLTRDAALLNRMGFNNDGAEKIAERLSRWRHALQNRSSVSQMLLGGNIGKNKSTPNEEAWKDYEYCFRALHPYVDFFVVNVSSPNTPGLRELQEKSSLHKILVHLQELNSSLETPRPILLKISPDLDKSAVEDVVQLALQIRLDGLVVSNTTISREGLQTDVKTVNELGAGGLSGKPLQQKSTALLKYIFSKTGGSLPVIASGGIFTAADANEKYSEGASLVEVWTGFIYEGPFIVRHISKKETK